MKSYIDQHEYAYKKINAVFRATLPQKMNLYTWNDPVLAQRLLGRKLGFADPWLYTCQVLRYQTIGHEMTHILSFWGWNIMPVERTRFINEGIAVAFSQNNNDKYAKAAEIVKGKGLHDVLEIWRTAEKLNEDIVYGVGGAFIIYLYQTITKEQFKDLVKNQTIENLMNILGSTAFYKIINDFNGKIGLNR